MFGLKKSISPTPAGVDGELAGRSSLKDQQYGVKVLAEGGSNPTIDLVAIHGLDGDRERTWTAKNHVSWLRDYLPEVIPNTRILAYGYDCRTHDSTELSCQKLHEHAISLATDLTLYRRDTDTTERPIIFIAHGVGGIIVKDALIHSNAANKKNLEHHNAIKTSTYGILFCGTPHQGTDIDNWTRNFIDTVSGKKTNDAVLKNLEEGSELLQKQLGQYNHISSDFDTKFFYETRKSLFDKHLNVGPERGKVAGAVDAEVFSINATYEKMVKFKSRKDEGYQKISSCLRLMVEAAPEKILENWKVQKRVKDAESNGVQLTFEIPFEPEYLINPHFTGRQGLLDQLHREIEKNQEKQTIVVLHGTGGMGKTQIASAYVHAHQHEYKSVFWINTATKDTLGAGFITVARRLIMQHAQVAYGAAPDYLLIAKNLDMLGVVDRSGFVSTEDEDTEKIIRGVKMWFAKKENQHWLLIFDNVDDLKGLDIQKYIPTAAHGKIIMTSRRTACANFGTGLEVTEMSEEEGKDLLMKRAKKADEPAIGELARQLGYLPLAIVQAGAYVAHCEMTIVKYLEIYQKQFNDIFGEQLPDPTWTYGDRTIRTTWEISFQAIAEEDSEAAQLLSLCAFLCNNDIREDMLRRGKGLEKCDITLSKCLGLLFSYSLAQRKGLPGSFYIHPVVHLWASKRLTEDECTGKTEEVVLLVQRATDREFAEFRTTQEYDYESRIWPHIEAASMNVTRYLKGRLEKAYVISSIGNLATLLTSKGRSNDAEGLQVQVVEAMKRVLGIEHPDTLLAISNLATTYWTQGRSNDAEELKVQVVEARKRVLGIEHPDTLSAISNLATTYSKQGRSNDAEELKAQVVEARKRVLGIEHPDTLLAISNLATTYWTQGRSNDAEELQVQVVEAMKRVLGIEHPDTLKAISNLAAIYSTQGRSNDAEGLEVQVVEAMKRVLGIEHPDTLSAINNLAATYWKQGRSNDAEELQVQVVEARKRVLGIEHPDTLKAIDFLDKICFIGNHIDTRRNIRKLPDTEDEMVARAIALSLGLGGLTEDGEGHSDSVAATDNQVFPGISQVWLDDEIVFLLQRLKGQELSQGHNHPTTLDTVEILGMTYVISGRLVEGEEQFSLVLEGRKQVLGNGHPRTLDAMQHIANNYMMQRRLREAKEIQIQLVEGRKQALGMEHPDTLEAMDLLDKICTSRDARRSAETEDGMVARAMALSLCPGSGEGNSNGVQGPDAIKTLANEAATYWDLGDWEKAGRLEFQVMMARKTKLGQHHPSTLLAMTNLAATYSELERWQDAEVLERQVVEVKSRTQGKEHPETLEAMINLVETYIAQGRWREAEDLQLQVIEARKKDLGENHLSTLSALACLAKNYWHQRKLGKAEELELQVVEARRTILGNDHIDTLTIMGNLAATYASQNRREDAKQLQQEVFEALSRTLGAKHFSTKSARELVDVYSQKIMDTDPETEDRELEESNSEERELQERDSEEQESEERKLKVRELRERNLKKRESKERGLKEKELQERKKMVRESEVRSLTVRDARERKLKERESKERELKERELKERELKEQELKERELKERELKEQELKERELKEREDQELEDELKDQEQKNDEQEHTESEDQEHEDQKLEDQKIQGQESVDQEPPYQRSLGSELMLFGFLLLGILFLFILLFFFCFLLLVALFLMCRHSVAIRRRFRIWGERVVGFL